MLCIISIENREKLGGTMDVLNLNSESAQSILRTVLGSKRCVPFIGAGFTAGEKSLGGSVPSVQEFFTIMIDELIKTEKYASKKDWLLKQKFYKVADYYWQDTASEQRDGVIRSRFTNVTVSSLKKTFLKCGWHNIVTLNIDDAIERANSTYKPILPHTKLKITTYKFNDLLVKVHGDAFKEISEKSDAPQVIFSRKSYWESSSSNQDILSLFSTNWRENNLLFIGCSLTEEIDLIYSLSSPTETPYPDTYRIYFTNKTGAEDSDFITTLDVDYKITHVFVVDSWDDIYSSCISLFPSDSATGLDKLEKYKFNKFIPLNETFDEVIEHLLQTDRILNAIDHFEKYVPHYLVERSITHDVLSSIHSNTFTLIEGRRFSGQSSLLKKIAKHLQPGDVYFFTSGSEISSELLETMIVSKNSYYLFDGRTLTIEHINRLIRAEAKIKSNDNKIIIVSSTTDGGLGTPLIDRFGDKIAFRLKQEFDLHETKLLNRQFDAVGISKVDSRASILNSIHKLAKIYEQYQSNIFPNGDQFTEKELQLLLLLFTNEKVSSLEANYVGFSISDFNGISNKYAPLLLKEENVVNPTSRGRFEILLNCKPWCASILNTYELPRQASDCQNLVSALIDKLKGSSFGKSIFLQLIRVDNLRVLFPTKHGEFIDSLFDSLKTHFNTSSDFWLQWAKATLYTSNNIDKLKISLNYAKKAEADGSLSTKKNATHTLALIAGKITELQSYKNAEDNIRAVKAFTEAIRNNDINTRYVRNLRSPEDKAHKQATRLLNSIMSDLKIDYLIVKNEIAELQSFFQKTAR